MNTQIKRIQTLDVELPAEKGTLARIYSAFREENISVRASWAYEMGPKEAHAHFIVGDIDKTTTVLKKMGFKTQVGNAFWFEGDDKIGAYAEILSKLAKAGVNVGATDALAVGTRFASVIFVDPKDVLAAGKALNL